MDIVEYTSLLKTEKADLEDDIFKILRDFQNRTGVTVSYVEIHQIHSLGDPDIVGAVNIGLAL